MPAKSRAQAIAIQIAEHHPEKLFAKNKGLLNMKPGDMKDFASTPTKGLPMHVPPVSSEKFGPTVPTLGKPKKKYYGER